MPQPPESNYYGAIVAVFKYFRVSRTVLKSEKKEVNEVIISISLTEKNLLIAFVSKENFWSVINGRLHFGWSFILTSECLDLICK